MRIYTRGGDKGKTGIHGGEHLSIRRQRQMCIRDRSVRCCLPIMNGRCCWVGYSVR